MFDYKSGRTKWNRRRERGEKQGRGGCGGGKKEEGLPEDGGEEAEEAAAAKEIRGGRGDPWAGPVGTLGIPFPSHALGLSRSREESTKEGLGGA